MTSEQLAPGQWRLSFTEPEANFLVNVLARLGKHYQDDIARMPPAKFLTGCWLNWRAFLNSTWPVRFSRIVVPQGGALTPWRRRFYPPLF